MHSFNANKTCSQIKDSHNVLIRKLCDKRIHGCGVLNEGKVYGSAVSESKSN